MTWYSDGTIALTNNSTEVVGTSLSFTAASIKQGDALVVGSVRVEIADIVDATHLHLTKVWGGSTNVSAQYHIEPIGQSHYNVGELIERTNDFINLLKLQTKNFVISKTITAPPVNPAIGDRYIVAAGSSGVWVNRVDDYAQWSGQSWDFQTPDELFGGVWCWVQDESKPYVYDNAWVLLPGQKGDTGIGIPAGGVDGQLIVKSQTDTEWSDFGVHELPRNILFNLFEDAGRFAGSPEPNTNSVGTFQPASYLIPLNGAIFSAYGKNTYNSITYGGTAAAISVDIVELVNKIKSTLSAKRYGIEFFVQKVVCGVGTSISHVAGGVTRYLSQTNKSSPLWPRSTWGHNLKVLSGSVAIFVVGSVDCYIDGILVSGDVVLSPSDGWVQVVYVGTSDPEISTGVASILYRVYGEPTTQYLQANCFLTPYQLKSHASGIGIVPSNTIWG